MRSRKVAVIVVALALVFLLGFGTNEIVRAHRVIIGNNQVVIGQDAFGGYLIIRDIRGKEVFSVQGGEVRMPTGGLQRSAMRTPRASGSVGAKVAQLQAVRPLVVNPAIHDQISELIAIAEDFEGKAREMDREAGQLRDRETRSKPIYYWDGHGHRHLRGMTDPISNVDLRAELREHSLDLRKLAKTKRGEAKRLQRSIAAPRQVITAWNGNRQIILITKGNMGNQISKISTAGFFTWTGSAARSGDIDIFDQSLEHFEIRTIKVASRREGWQDTP